MKVAEAEGIAVLAAVGVGIYIAYQLVQGAKKVGQGAADATVNTVNDLNSVACNIWPISMMQTCQDLNQPSGDADMGSDNFGIQTPGWDD